MGSVIPLRAVLQDRRPAGPTALPPRYADTVFVGREREMQALEHSLEATTTGQGHLVFLSGEAGIGKTRLALEFATAAGLRGARVLIGRSIEESGAPPFWPWVQIVRTYLATHESQVIRTAMGPGAAEIAQVIPEVKEHIPGVGSPPELVPEQARCRFFASVTAFFANVAMGSPLVLVLDDLQWADTPSLLLVQFLTRQLAALRVVVVGTYRAMAWPASHPLRTMLGAVAHEPFVSRLALQDLSEQAVARCLEQTLGVAPTATLVTAVYQHTAGQPFLLTEVIRILRTAGMPYAEAPQVRDATNLPVPQRVRAVVSRRLQPLAADDQLCLSVAAVIGHNPATRAAPPGPSATHLFRQAGDYWTISDAETVFHLKHVRGLSYIAHLLQHPHQELHVFELTTRVNPPAPRPSVPGRAFAAVSGGHGGDLGDAGDILDAPARRAYQQRLHELQVELEETQRHNDIGRQAVVQMEMDMLLEQLAAAVGLGGRSRHAASQAERARVNVTNGIRGALRKIAVHSPALAQYLTMTINTGLMCSYTPPPQAPLRWQF